MQLNSTKADRIVNVFAIIVIDIIVLFSLIRLFFGVELTDEAYSVAETYMVSRGALPFVNNWSQMPGWTLLLAPFIKLYTFIMGGTDGIVLFFRFLAFTINVLTALMIAHIFRDHVKNKKVLLLIVLIYVCATGWDYVVQIRGDRLAIDLLAVGVALIIAFFADDKQSMKYPFWSGSFLALSVLSYPTFALEYAFFVIAIFTLCRIKKANFRGFFFFLLGSSLFAFLTILYLSIFGGFINIFEGIRFILKDLAYFKLENTGITKLPDYIKTLIFQMVRIIGLSLVSLLIIMILSMIKSLIVYQKGFIKKVAETIGVENRKFEIDNIIFSRLSEYMSQYVLISIIVGICLYHIDLIMTYKTANHSYISLYAMSAQTLSVILVWPFINTKKTFCKYLMGLIWFPTFLWVVITGIGTYASMINRHPLFKNSAFLLGLFVYFAIDDIIVSPIESRREIDGEKRFIISCYYIIMKLLPVVLMTVILSTYMFNAYSYVYRDESIRNLNTVIEAGPYRGMRTTEKRAIGLIELDETLDLLIDKDDYVLAMDNAPFIYLMSEGHICTPCTWDQTLYSYHFDLPDLYYDYFKVTETKPTKIIYYNYGRDEILSIDVEYKFNDFVRNHYGLLYENRDLYTWNYCGKDTICELLVYEEK